MIVIDCGTDSQMLTPGLAIDKKCMFGFVQKIFSRNVPFCYIYIKLFV